ncbi:hypothetical protein ACJMK2_040138 [Sinanodonta woodiana]|uniref:Uncharacterized protein n=1 Tax=Sinanodonta woodiana TaxID=1069815 RepID=A0ABD3WE32_SINWO
MSSHRIESNKAADSLSVTGYLDMSEQIGNVETSAEEDKTADTKSDGMPIVIAGGAGDTEMSNEGNRKVDDWLLSNVMVTSDKADTLTEPSKMVKFLLTASSTATVDDDGSGNSETDKTIYTQSPDDQQTHHSAIIVEATGDQKMFDKAIVTGRTESALLGGIS